jgi:hypothetical protein
MKLHCIEGFYNGENKKISYKATISRYDDAYVVITKDGGIYVLVDDFFAGRQRSNYSVNRKMLVDLLSAESSFKTSFLRYTSFRQKDIDEFIKEYESDLEVGKQQDRKKKYEEAKKIVAEYESGEK